MAKRSIMHSLAGWLIDDVTPPQVEDALRGERSIQRKAILARSKHRIGLERKVAILSRVVVGLVAVLEAKGQVTQRDLSTILADLEIYDENGDGRIDADDLAKRFPQAGESAPKRPRRRRSEES